MSANKKNMVGSMPMNDIKKYETIETPVIVIDDNEVAVSKPTARAFYIMKDTIFVHNMITFFLIVGIIMYLLFYLLYSYENNKLIKEASRSCPTFSCPPLVGKSEAACDGRAYHLRPGGEIVCTQ